jgi:hypothetical protein
MCGLLESTLSFLRTHIPINVLKPSMKVGVVVSDHLEVAAEERVVADIEPDDRCVPTERSSQAHE